MDFEVIDRTHKDINILKYSDKAIIHMTLEKKSVYFTAGAVKVFKMNGEGKFISFLRGKDHNGEYNDKWHFVVSKKCQGFKITTMPSGGARICSTSFIRLFTKGTRFKEGHSFFLQKTNHTLDGDPVHEVMVHRAVQEIRKN